MIRLRSLSFINGALMLWAAACTELPAPAVEHAEAGASDAAGSDAATSQPEADGGGGDVDAGTDGGALDSGIEITGPIDLVVDTGPTGAYSVNPAKRSLFRFPVKGAQLYCLAGLSGNATAYLGANASVSPTVFQYKTDASGHVCFTPGDDGLFYALVADTTEFVSGTIQVASGGEPLALGSARTVTLASPAGQTYYYYRFPISVGHTYRVAITGTAGVTYGRTLASSCERDLSGSFSVWEEGGGEGPPSAWDVQAAWVQKSYSGFYFLLLRPSATTTLSIMVTQTN